MTEYIYRHELFSFFLVFLSTLAPEYIGKVQLVIYFFPQLSNAQLSVPHGGLGKEARVGCSAMLSYWRGKGGRKEGVKELSLLLSLLISPLLSSFRGFPVVLSHCPLNWSTCSSTHYWYATGPNRSAPTPAGHRCAAQSCLQH